MENNFSLTKEQKRVICGTEKIKKVIACAGSGKTSVLIAAITETLKSRKCRPSEILALTFTKNAALNMKTRIARELPDFKDYETIDIFTFNSFGNQIIKENSFLFGLSKNFNLLNEAKAWQIIFQIFKDADFKYLKAGKDIAGFTKKILAYIWDIKNNLIDNESIKNYLEEASFILSKYQSKSLRNEELKKVDYLKEIHDIYLEYEKIKSSENSVDYADQIFLPYMLFSKVPAIQEKYRQRYKYIFVDEFQDTNNSQARLLSRIFDSRKNKIMVVGDDDQGIYGFRGASIENIIDMQYFMTEPEAGIKTYFLTKNFRSGEKIINFVNNVIGNNRERNLKIIEAEYEGKESDIYFFKTTDMIEEAERIGKIIRHLRDSGMLLKDIAILCRRKNFNEIIKVLEKENIRYEFIGNKNFFYENEILFIVSWLKLIYNIYDEESLVYLLKSSGYKISDRDIYFLRRSQTPGAKNIHNDKKNTAGHKKHLIDSVKEVEKNAFLTKSAIAKLKSFFEDLKYYIKQSELFNLSGIINLIFHYSGLHDELNSGFEKKLKKKIKNIESLIKIASDFEREDSQNNFESFILYLQQLAKTETEDPDNLEISDNNAIKIMSIHAAKGLEFKTVFLPMLWGNDYKPRLSTKTEFEIPAPLRTDSRVWREKALFKSADKFKAFLKERLEEEERRIFYVAASRAEKLLIMSYPIYRLYHGSADDKTNELLKFVDEGFLSEEENKNTDFSFLQKNINNKYVDKKREERCINNIKRKKIISVFENKKKITTVEKQLAIKIKKAAEVPDKKEKIFCAPVRQKEKPEFFSLTEILTYMECPRLYEYRYRLNLSEKTDKKKADTGIKIHKFAAGIVEELFKAYKTGRTREIKNSDYNLLLKKYNDDISLIADEAVRSCFFNLINSSLIDFQGISKIYLEELFYWKIDDFFIRCQIDRADLSDEGFLKIYDYKTGSKNNMATGSYYKNQIYFYIIAISDYLKVSLEKIGGYICFLRSGDTDNYFCNNELKISLQKKIKQAVSGIIQENFKSKPRKKCNECSYRSLCF